MNKKRIVITGMGAITPIGNTVKDYWQNLIKGISGADFIDRFDVKEHKTKFACQIKDYEPEFFFHKREVKKLDKYTQYGLIATEEAIVDSQIAFQKEDLTQIGVVWGTGIGGLETFEDEVIKFAQKKLPSSFSPFLIPKMISNITSGHISIKYGLKGPSYTTVSACSSSSNAFIDAVYLILFGAAHTVITGGSEAPITHVGVGGFNAIRALSQRNNDPKTASRPFDKDRDGFVLGEGSGCMILEDYEHAKRRNAKIYAEVIGIGMSSDAYHITQPHPEGKGVIQVMKQTLKTAHLQPKDIDYINLHGTSTILGDLHEVEAIQKVFKEHAYQMNLSSTKSMTGHLLGAAGAIENIASVLAIQHQQVPPTINHFNKDEKIDQKLQFTFNRSKKRDIKIAMSNNFGFGGHNCSLIFKKYV